MDVHLSQQEMYTISITTWSDITGEMELGAEQAAAVYHCGLEVLKEVPLGLPVIESRFYEKYAAGDSTKCTWGGF